jgi:dipeptidyl aminopeptidase/acylaminoacyl peptidase
MKFYFASIRLMTHFFRGGVAISLLAIAALFVNPLIALAQNDLVKPVSNLEVIGIPPIPASIPREVQPYLNIYGLPLAGWDSTKREILLKDISSVTWVSRVQTPGASSVISPIYIQENGIYDIYFQPQDRYLAYTRDANGNETFQLYLYDIATRASTQLSDGKSRNTEPVWSKAGNKIVYSSTPTGESGVSLRLVNPSDPKSDRLLVRSTGGYLKAFDWSPDDRQIVFCDFTANTASSLWLVDVASGEKRLLSPKTDRSELYDSPQFSHDGKGLYVITDHDSDVRRLAYIDLRTQKFIYLTDHIKWDVDEFQLAPDGRSLAFLINEEGWSKLHLLDIASGKESQVTQLPAGIFSDLKWHNNSVDLAFNYKSSQTPNDVYSLNIQTGKVEIWAKSITGGVDTSRFSSPELIHWKSFDNRTISGFIYRPPDKFKGKHPVIIDIHGGPEEQYRPGFGYEDNYFLNELGVAKIYPNVRGSSGYGRDFLALDNGMRREGAVEDIGKLIEWIKSQPDLDANRIMVLGASYGGYLALSAAIKYNDQIKTTLAESAITDLATFVARTEGWRRGLQRSEFGDERDPQMKAFMERTAPLNNARQIKKPLFLIHGINDPRVPVSEAEAIYQAVKSQTTVWYLLAKDEGHGFARPENRNYRLYSIILFVREYLLK